MTCLVAGGAGFIGLNLCEKLLNDGDNVICIDSLITGDRENITYLLKNPKFKFIEQDITVRAGQISNLQCIYHLASPASPNKKSPRSYINHPIETLLANSLGTHQLLELTKKSGAKFLYASSSEVYGEPQVSPQKEDYFGNVNPVGPRSVYDEGKRFGEAMTMAYFRQFDIDVRVVRIFNTYGGKMQKDDGRVVSNFITQAISSKPITVYGDGKQTRSFCFISDMVEGLSRAMNKDGTRGEIINLGNPVEQTILEFATMVKELTGSKSQIVFEELPPDDPKRRKPDIGKAQKLLGWQPVVNLEEGLKKTIEYFRTIK